MAAKAKSTSPSAAAGGSRRASTRAGAKRDRTTPPAADRQRLGEDADLHVAAALIVAHNQARRIAATVRAARAIPGIDLVLVVDDGSTDNTQDLARKAGAVVVRHSHVRGRTVAVETGVSVIAMRDDPRRTPRAILLLQGGLGNYAIGAAPLVQAVIENRADLAVALTETRTRSIGIAATAARKAIEKASNWRPQQPLSRIRCVTRQAIEAAMPLARGVGLEVGMTLDVLTAGLTVTEVACEIRHKPHTGADASPSRRLSQYRDVMVALSARRVKTGLRSTRIAVGSRLHKSEQEKE